MAIKTGLNFGLTIRTRRQKTLERNITGSVQKGINKGLKSIEKELTRSMRALISGYIHNSPEYYSLVSATLRGEFGLTHPKQALEEIIETFLSSFKTELKLSSVSGNTFFAYLKINVQVDFERLANISAGFQEATNQDNPAAGGVSLLPWLRWLLLEGSSPLVFDHSVSRSQGRGRSGLNFLMTFTPGQNYFISKRQFTGTEDSNFLTRAVSRNRNHIEKHIRKKSSELLRRSFKI